jgi:hypothetical protein
MISFREAHPELEGRFIDVKYRDLVTDPLSVVRRIYRQLEMPLTKMAAERMKRLAAMRSRYKGKGTRTNPTLAQLGLDEAVERRRFKVYCSWLDTHFQESALK